MTMKQRVENILGDFLKRNKEYIIELYISNAITSNNIGQFFITSDHVYETDEKKFILKWDKDENYDVRYNEFSVLYDEIIACYEDIDKEDNLKISETVKVILKNGMEFDFDCCGLRLG